MSAPFNSKLSQDFLDLFADSNGIPSSSTGKGKGKGKGKGNLKSKGALAGGFDSLH